MRVRLMCRFTITVFFLLLCVKGPVFAQEDLRVVVSAAMGEAMVDARYQRILDKYGLPMPDFAATPALASPERNRYPERVSGTLLNQVLDRRTLRIGWIGVGVPFSFVGPDSTLQGLAIDLWPLVLEKLSMRYGKKIEPVYVEFTDATGNNNMYRQLSTDGDHHCAALRLASPAICYDIIGGAYAFNEPRKRVSKFTAAYYPLNMSGVRTPVVLIGKDGKRIVLDTPQRILAAAKNADNAMVFAALAATGEVQFLNELRQQFGDTFKVVTRPPDSNILEFAQETPAHIVLGTNVRIYYTRVQTPQFCTRCEVVNDLLKFDGIGFATALPK